MGAFLGGALVVIAGIAVLFLAFRVVVAAHSRPKETADEQKHGAPSQPHTGLERVVLRAVGGTMRLMIRIGVHLGPMYLLTVAGRKTGLPRTNPVDLFERDSRYWLVATHTAGANWVRNLRRAGEGGLTRGRTTYLFTAVELPQEHAGVVLKEVLGPRLAKRFAGLILRQTMGVSPDASIEEFTSAAVDHPVFELELTTDATGGSPSTRRSSPPKSALTEKSTGRRKLHDGQT